MIRFAATEAARDVSADTHLLGPPDWTVFLSPRGARAWSGRPTTEASGQIAVVGTTTRSVLEQRGFRVALQPTRATAARLADALLERIASEGNEPDKTRILLIQGAQGRDDFANIVRSTGAHVEILIAYETLPPTEANYANYVSLLDKHSVDAFVFTAPSTFLNFVLSDALRAQLNDAQLFAIGPTTQHAIRSAGWQAHVAHTHDYGGLIDVVCERLKEE